MELGVAARATEAGEGSSSPERTTAQTASLARAVTPAPERVGVPQLAERGSSSRIARVHRCL